MERSLCIHPKTHKHGKMPMTINATNEMHHDERIALSLVPVEDGITLALKR